MDPKTLATELRTIAARIDNSKRPDRSRVSAAIKRLLAAVLGTPPVPMSRGEDRLDVHPLELEAWPHAFYVRGVIAGEPVDGTAYAPMGGDLEYEPSDGSGLPSEGVLMEIVGAVGELDQIWAQSLMEAGDAATLS